MDGAFTEAALIVVPPSAMVPCRLLPQSRRIDCGVAPSAPNFQLFRTVT
jgi:hypothetical protein